VGEGVTRCCVVIDRTAGVDQHGDEGEGYKYNTTNSDDTIEPADFVLLRNRGWSHLQDYTREGRWCQGWYRRVVKKAESNRQHEFNRLWYNIRETFTTQAVLYNNLSLIAHMLLDMEGNYFCAKVVPYSRRFIAGFIISLRYRY
jgi:hypothetical protein